jgi:hypothetical protein
MRSESVHSKGFFVDRDNGVRIQITSARENENNQPIRGAPSADNEVRVAVAVDELVA